MEVNLMNYERVRDPKWVRKKRLDFLLEYIQQDLEELFSMPNKLTLWGKLSEFETVLFQRSFTDIDKAGEHLSDIVKVIKGIKLTFTMWIEKLVKYRAKINELAPYQPITAFEIKNVRVANYIDRDNGSLITASEPFELWEYGLLEFWQLFDGIKLDQVKQCEQCERLYIQHHRITKSFCSNQCRSLAKYYKDNPLKPGRPKKRGRPRGSKIKRRGE